MIEYILLISLFSLVAVPGVSRLREGTTSQAHNTQTRLGGTPVGTTPPPTTRAPVTTTTLPPSFLLVDAGPDVRVAPDQVVTQTGTMTSPGNPIISSSWAYSGPSTSSFSAWQGPIGGTPENQTSTYNMKSRRPGVYYLSLTATNGTESKSDYFSVKVTSGAVTPSISMTQWWDNSAMTRWDVYGLVYLVNQFGEYVPSTDVAYRFTRSDGVIVNGVCTTDSYGYCSGMMVVPTATVAWVDFEITGLAGPCLDSVTGLPVKQRSSAGSIPLYVPPTTTSTPATTSTTSTSTSTTTSTTAAPTTTAPHNG